MNIQNKPNGREDKLTDELYCRNGQVRRASGGGRCEEVVPSGEQRAPAEAVAQSDEPHLAQAARRDDDASHKGGYRGDAFP